MDNARQQRRDDLAHLDQSSQPYVPDTMPDKSNEELVEVWGDTVSFPALLKSIFIGAVISVSFFYLSQYLLNHWLDKKSLVHAYSMLCGLVGCLVAGFVCSILYKPKREILESENQAMQWFDALLEQWENEGQSIGSVHDLPEKLVQELKELNLYDAFVKHAEQHRQKEST